MSRGRHLSKDALNRFWHNVRAEGGIVDVLWPNCVSVPLNEFADGAARHKLKRTMSDPEWLRPGETRQTVTERAAATFVECWARDLGTDAMIHGRWRIVSTGSMFTGNAAP